MKGLFRTIDGVFHPLLIPIYAILVYFWMTPNFYTPYLFYILALVSFFVGFCLPLLAQSIFRFLYPLDNNFSTESREFLIFHAMGLGYLYNYKYSIGLIGFHITLFVSCILIAYGCLTLFSFFKIRISTRATLLAVVANFWVIISVYFQLNFTLLIGGSILLWGVVSTTELFLQKQSQRSIFLSVFCGLPLQWCYVVWLANH